MNLLASPEIFVGSIIGALLLLYMCVALLRIQRFRALSSRLHATYMQTGWFGPGKVIGSNFAIQARTTGGGGRSYRTYVEVMSPQLPGAYILKREFFEAFPDWRYAMTPGKRTERVFIAHVSLSAYVETSPDQRRTLLEWFRGCDIAQVYPSLKKLRIREISFENGHASISFGGAVSSDDRLRSALRTLCALAKVPPPVSASDIN